MPLSTHTKIPRNLQYFCSLYFLPLIVPRNQVYSYTIPIGIKGQKYITHYYIHELIYIYIYIYNHLCQTYWLPLYASTNPINKYKIIIIITIKERCRRCFVKVVIPFIVYTYINIYIFLSCHCRRPYFSFSMRTKLRKALYQTRMKLLTCFYGKILFDTYILPL